MSQCLLDYAPVLCKRNELFFRFVFLVRPRPLIKSKNYGRVYDALIKYFNRRQHTRLDVREKLEPRMKRDFRAEFKGFGLPDLSVGLFSVGVRRSQDAAVMPFFKTYEEVSSKFYDGECLTKLPADVWELCVLSV